MEKELIILKYKINVSNLSASRGQEIINECMKNSIGNSEDLKDNYIIKEIFVPVNEGNSDVEIIYPIPQYTTSPEINKLVDEITESIKNDPDKLMKQWNKLVRELKIRQLSI